MSTEKLDLLTTHLTFTCSNSTIKTLKKGVKTPERRHSLGMYFTTFSSVSTVDFKQVKVSWDEAW